MREMKRSGENFNLFTGGEERLDVVVEGGVG